MALTKVRPIRAEAEPPRVEPPRKKRNTNPAPLFLTEEEIAKLFKVIDSARDRAIFRVGYHAGLRASEVGLIEMRDYNPKTERLHVERVKGSHSGDHHMVREEARALRGWIKERGNAPGPIFTSNRRSPISRRMLDVLMKQYGAKAGIPAKLRHFHVLKHSCGTHLLSRGFNVEQVQDWMGHVNIQNTLIYARVTNSRRGEMGKALRDTWK